jgi:hypothetical protein
LFPRSLAARAARKLAPRSRIASIAIAFFAGHH